MSPCPSFRPKFPPLWPEARRNLLGLTGTGREGAPAVNRVTPGQETPGQERDTHLVVLAGEDLGERTFGCPEIVVMLQVGGITVNVVDGKT